MGQLAGLPCQALLNQQAAQLQSAAPVSDSYLSQISDESLEVLEHFGAEAPQLLNTYACAVEDALIEQVQRGQSQALMLEAAGEERSAMNLMLTDPDVLADYVNDFFGPSGPYPTETAEETAIRQQEEAREQFAREIEAQEQGRVPQSFNRPEMDMPTPGRQVNAANDFWGNFSSMMDQNPENAWQFLSGAPSGAPRGPLERSQRLSGALWKDPQHPRDPQKPMFSLRNSTIFNKSHFMKKFSDQ